MLVLASVRGTACVVLWRKPGSSLSDWLRGYEAYNAPSEPPNDVGSVWVRVLFVANRGERCLGTVPAAQVMRRDKALVLHRYFIGAKPIVRFALASGLGRLQGGQTGVEISAGTVKGRPRHMDDGCRNDFLLQRVGIGQQDQHRHRPGLGSDVLQDDNVGLLTYRGQRGTNGLGGRAS